MASNLSVFINTRIKEIKRTDATEYILTEAWIKNSGYQLPAKINKPKMAYSHTQLELNIVFRYMWDSFCQFLI